MSYSAEVYLNLLGDKVGRENVGLVLIALVILILSVFLALKFVLTSSARKDGVLLVGLSDSGKTLMLSKLIGHHGLKTVASLKENVTVYSTNGKSLKLIDIPGSDGIRQKYFEKHKSNAGGIIFVIDSNCISKNIKDVAELLYNVLIDDSIVNSSLDLLVACNKQDLLASKSSKAIQTQLEREITTLRKTRSAQLISTDDTTSKDTFLGKKGEDFEFQQLRKLSVDFAECFVKGQTEEESNLDEITHWLHRRV